MAFQLYSLKKKVERKVLHVSIFSYMVLFYVIVLTCAFSFCIHDKQVLFKVLLLL